MTMTSAAELEELENAKTPEDRTNYLGFLYGEFGKRKTTIACRCAVKKCVLLHADRGWHVYKNRDELRDRVIPVRYEGLSQIRSLVDAIVNEQGSFAGVDLLVIDTISQIQEEFIDFLMATAHYGGKYRDQMVPRQDKKKEFGGLKMGNAIDVPAPVDYHVVRNAFRPVIRALTQSPLDVILTAHVREPGPMDKKKVTRPNLTEATYNLLGREASFIGYMYKQGGQYYTDFNDTPTRDAKSQIKEMQGKIETEDLPSYLKAWKERVS